MKLGMNIMPLEATLTFAILYFLQCSSRAKCWDENDTRAT